MEKTVTFRDRQEVGPDDLNNLQASVKTSNDHMVSDFVTTEKRFSGFQVTKESSNSIRVGIGRFYQDGKIYAADDELVISVQNKLPLTNRLILSVYVFGQEIETDVQERNFVSNISVFPPVGEPEAVPMLVARVAQVGVIDGISSTDPVAPALPSNALLVAMVILTTTGVLDGGISRMINNIVPNLQAQEYQLKDIAIWRQQNGAKVDALTSELAATSARTFGKADVDIVNGLMADFSRLKRLANLPNNGAPYDTDLYADSEQIDQTLTPVNTNYRISSFGGADFPHAAEAIAPLGLFNPYNNDVYRSGTDLVLPKFEHVVAVETAGYSGEVNIGSFSVTTTVTKLMTGTKTETRYGWA